MGKLSGINQLVHQEQIHSNKHKFGASNNVANTLNRKTNFLLSMNN